jgi:hypothetical protein
VVLACGSLALLLLAGLGLAWILSGRRLVPATLIDLDHRSALP